MKFNNLSFKIPFVISILLIIVEVILISIITKFSIYSIENTAIKTLYTSLSSYYDMINLYFEEKNLVMDIYAKDTNIINFLKNPTDENRLLAENSLKRFTEEVKDTEVFYNYSLVNFDGQIFLDSVGGGLSNINYGKTSEDWKRFANTGYDFAGRDFVQPSFYDINNPIYVIWKGIKDENGNILGVLNSSINWGKFLKEYIAGKKIGDNGTLCIIDKNRNIIAHTDTNRLYIYQSDVVNNSSYVRKENTRKQKEDDFFKYILEQKNGTYNYVNDDGFKYICSFRPIKNTSWYLIVSYTNDEIFKDVNRLIIISIIVSIVLILIITLFLFFYSKAMLSPLNLLVDEAKKIANGNIIIGTIPDKYLRKDEIGELVKTFREMKRAIRNIIDIAENSINETRDNVNELVLGGSTLFTRTEENIIDIASVASSTEEISSTIQQTSMNSVQIDSMMKESKDMVDKAYESIIETAETAKLVSEVSSKIGNITKSIEDIAMQTGLLALNASVEAARAGDQGKGFAVVASEVRALSQTSSVSVKSIIELINESNEKIKKSEKSSMESKKLFEDIKNKIDEMSVIVNEFSIALKEQESGINKINENMAHIEDTTKENENFITSLNDLTLSLKENTKSIEDAISFFKS